MYMIRKFVNHINIHVNVYVDHTKIIIFVANNKFMIHENIHIYNENRQHCTIIEDNKIIYLKNSMIYKYELPQKSRITITNDNITFIITNDGVHYYDYKKRGNIVITSDGKVLHY